MKAPLTVAVVVCTHLHERRDQLAAALSSLEAQTRRPDEVVLVVDGDERLHSDVRLRHNDVRVVWEGARRGLAAARNSGAAAVRSDIIMFLDDDAVADAGWVARLSSGMSNDQVLGASGTSLPLWETGQPAWLPDEFLWLVGCSYRGQASAGRVVRNVYGGCCALRRSLFTDLGGYDTRLGRSANSYGGGEEAELCLRAKSVWPDRIFLFEPDARIYHNVPASRCTWSYALRRAYGEGRMKALVADLSHSSLTDERRFGIALLRTMLHSLAGALRLDRPQAARLLGLIALPAAVVSGLATGHIAQAVGRRVHRGMP